MRYSKKLIYDYIMGNELEIDVEKLEKDFYFMKEVITYSNDKNMYYLCDETLKNNYEFILFLINKFNNDKNFIVKISEDFKKNNDLDSKVLIDLNAIVNKYLNLNCHMMEEENYDLWMANELFLISKYEIGCVYVENYKRKYENENIKMGFLYFNEEYKGYNNALDYFATRMVSKIFNNIDIEKFLHKNIRNISTLKTEGINNYLFNYIGYYDEYLSSYLMLHSYILNDVKKEIKKYIERWKKYEEENRRNEISSIIGQCFSYFSSCGNYPVDSFKIFRLVSKEFNCYDEVKKELVHCDFDLLCNTDDDTLNFGDIKFYLKVKEIFKEKLQNDVDAFDPYVDSEENKTCKYGKILQINGKK